MCCTVLSKLQHKTGEQNFLLRDAHWPRSNSRYEDGEEKTSVIIIIIITTTTTAIIIIIICSFYSPCRAQASSFGGVS
jgi:hypothetical protein